MNKKPKLADRISIEADRTEFGMLTEKVGQIKHQLKISEELARTVSDQIKHSYEDALEAIQLVGGSDDDLAKMWGYNFGGILYDYLAKREAISGRKALSFIRMQLGYELNTRLEGNEIQVASFVLGLSLRFMKGFEKLKENLNDLESALVKFEKNNYVPKTQNEEEVKSDLFGRGSQRNQNK
ncbi:MAG: hypothetical protein ACFE8U_12780 [Candidatus Hermodarchaeota archaeon]